MARSSASAEQISLLAEERESVSDVVVAMEEAGGGEMRYCKVRQSNSSQHKIREDRENKEHTSPKPY